MLENGQVFSLEAATELAVDGFIDEPVFYNAMLVIEDYCRTCGENTKRVLDYESSEEI